MKNKTDTEMDLLLRRHGRRNSSGASSGSDARVKLKEVADTPHMDADELSLYAEGALSETARSRYSAHLADCDACRTIVTGLVLSTSLETEEKQVAGQAATEPRPSWRDWLKALFAPTVLRYAVPAMALAGIVAVVIIVATRNRDEANFVAKNEQTSQTANRSEAKQEGTAATTNTTAEEARENHGNDSSVSQNANVEQKDAAAPVVTEQQQKETNSESGYRDQQGETSVAERKVSELPANEPAPPPKPEGNAAEERRNQNLSPGTVAQPTDDVAKVNREKDESELAAQKRRESSNEVVSNAPATSTPAAGRANRRAQPMQGAAVGGSASADSSMADKKSKTDSDTTTARSSMRGRRDSAGEDSTETRSVAGHTFQRRNGVWVDTAYNSSRSATRVKRGSEQFRALVGDEPTVGTVAAQLSGDVIVVVGGRAYRIY